MYCIKRRTERGKMIEKYTMWVNKIKINLLDN